MKDLIIFAVIPIILSFTTGFCISKMLCEKEVINSKIFISDPPSRKIIFGDIDEYKYIQLPIDEAKEGQIPMFLNGMVQWVYPKGDK